MASAFIALGMAVCGRRNPSEKRQNVGENSHYEWEPNSPALSLYIARALIKKGHLVPETSIISEPGCAVRLFLRGHPVRVVNVKAATREDVASWLDVVHEVEPLFGPMPAFESVLLRGIDRGTALCVRDASGRVLGGLLLQAPPATRITWLAVRASARGRGVGTALVAEALRRCPPPCEVLVDTFGADNAKGRPARRLYASFGFTAAEHLPPGPEGGSRQRFRLQRR
jgi:GNAT superfamily N-acetyltransferase